MGEQNDSLFPRCPIMKEQEVHDHAEDISQAVYSLIINELPWECFVEYKQGTDSPLAVIKEKMEVWQLAQDISMHVNDEIESYYLRSKSCEENM